MNSLVAYCCLTVPLTAAWAPAPSSTLVLLAGNPEYEALKASEQRFEGTLQAAPGSTDRKAALYQLLIREVGAAPVVRALHLPGKVHLIEPHAGKRVRITGKLVRDARGDRLWPGRLEPIHPPRMGGDGILARTWWQPASALRRGASHAVYRGGDELARDMGVNGATADETATQLLAKRLEVEAIDWSKHMVVRVSAGLVLGGVRLEITGITREKKALVVTYRLVDSGDRVAALGYPAEAALVKRQDGPVRFEKAPPPGKKERSVR
jgi:hypothetical protein